MEFYLSIHGAVLQKIASVSICKHYRGLVIAINKFTVLQKNKRIKKGDIYTALGIKETSLGDAEEATRILRIFGEGGTHPADEVVSKVSLTTDPPKGSVQLLKFLKAYDMAHSSNIFSV